MNWVGGSRSRIRTQNEKKLQKEFFERKKFTEKVHRYTNAGNKKYGLGQDFKAIQTANMAHQKSKINGNDSLFRPVKKIDLDVAKQSVGRRMVEDIDLGPVSPSSNVSRISLNEPKHEKSLAGFDTLRKDFDHRNQNSYDYQKEDNKSAFKFQEFQKDVKEKLTFREMNCETPMLEIFDHLIPKNNKKKFSGKGFDPSTGNTTHLTDTFKETRLGLIQSNSEDFPTCLKTPVNKKPKMTSALSVTFSEKTVEISPLHWSAINKISRKSYVKKKNKKKHFEMENFQFESKYRNKKSSDGTNCGWNEKPATVANGSTKTNIFAVEDFQFTPLQKYQSSSEEINQSKNDVKNNPKWSEYNSNSLKDLKRGYLTPADKIDLSIKKMNFPFSQTIPFTSTPLVPTATLPDISVNKLELEEPKFYGEKLTLQRNFNNKESVLPSSKTFGRNENLACFSPIEASIFPENLAVDRLFTPYDTTKSYKMNMTLKSSPAIKDSQTEPQKIALKTSPRKSGARNCLGDLQKETGIGNANLATSTSNSQIEEILEELHHLEKEESDGMLFDEVESRKNHCDNRKKVNNIEEDFSQEAPVPEISEISNISADVRQDNVTRDIASKILSKIISQIECEEVSRDLSESIPYSDEETENLQMSGFSEIESKSTVGEEMETYENKPTITTVTSSTQTEKVGFTDSSTSPTVIISTDKGVQVRSVGVSPINFDSSVSSDLIVKPYSRSCDVSIEMVKIAEVIDNTLENCDHYCLRSRKSTQDF